MLFFLPLPHNSISNLAKVGGKETSMREGGLLGGTGFGSRNVGRRRRRCILLEEDTRYTSHFFLRVSPRFFVQIWQEIKGRRGRRKAEREEDERNWANPEMLGARTEEPTFFPLAFVGRKKSYFVSLPLFPPGRRRRLKMKGEGLAKGLRTASLTDGQTFGPRKRKKDIKRKHTQNGTMTKNSIYFSPIKKRSGCPTGRQCLTGTFLFFLCLWVSSSSSLLSFQLSLPELLMTLCSIRMMSSSSYCTMGSCLPPPPL